MTKVSNRIFFAGRDRDADLFKLTYAWIKELRWDDSEYGAWTNDPKRPFGNSGNIYIADDILHVIGYTHASAICPNCNEQLDSLEIARAREYAHDLFAEIPAYLARHFASLSESLAHL